MATSVERASRIAGDRAGTHLKVLIRDIQDARECRGEAAGRRWLRATESLYLVVWIVDVHDQKRRNPSHARTAHFDVARALCMHKNRVYKNRGFAHKNWSFAHKNWSFVTN